MDKLMVHRMSRISRDKLNLPVSGLEAGKVRILQANIPKRKTSLLRKRDLRILVVAGNSGKSAWTMLSGNVHAHISVEHKESHSVPLLQSWQSLREIRAYGSIFHIPEAPFFI